MDPLLDSQVPQDPDSFHQLHWTPGSFGKGMLMPDGSLHHWNTGKVRDGNPTHRQYVQQVGNYDLYKRPEARDAYTMFHIDPDGGTQVLTGHENKNQISHIDPRLREAPYGEEWKFADSRVQQRELDRQNLGPVEFEQKHDWDESLKYDHPDETEWVPTSELKKFMEYDRRPGQPDSYSTPERWNALKEHITQHGFGNPVILDFNPDTGTAHMSEGNHRTQVALDSAIPAVPVRVYRSRRTSPAEQPVKATPLPEWEDKHSPDGYHWPSNLKPSHIGLPTVPPPGQEPETNWSLGKTASGIRIVEGQTPAHDSDWAFTDRSSTHMPMLYDEELGPTVYIGKGGTHHSDLIKEFQLNPSSIHAWGYVDTDGYHDSSDSFPEEAVKAALDHVTTHHGTDFGQEESEHWTF